MALAKVQIEVVHTGDKYSLRYNPEEYTLNKENNFAVQNVPGLSGPLVQFVNGNLRTLEMELFFDTWDTPDLPKQDVRHETDKVINLMNIDSTLHAPPLLNVSWSSLQFQCVLARASQKFILFADDGTPVRARLSVTFNEVIDTVLEASQVKRSTADYTKVHIVNEGETLSSIAGRMYSSPHLWRPIAIANNIADPREISVGQALRIPSLPFTDPDSLEVLQ
jgi:nucleoid-associated protein YgaU